MENELVTFDTAKLAKEKGFTIRGIKLMGYTSKFYNHNTKTLLAYGRTGRTDLTKAYFAPTQSLLQRWLREEHDLIVVALPYTLDNKERTRVYIWLIHKKFSSTAKDQYFKTFEEALESGLEKALKLIK